MNINKKYFLSGGVVLIAVAADMLKYWDYVTNPWTRDGQVRADVVQVTPRVSGPIVKLAAEDNQFVRAGDLLFEIDPRTFAARLAQAKAEYDNALDKQVEAEAAQVEVSRAAVVRAESVIRETDAQIKKDQAEYKRQQLGRISVSSRDRRAC